MKKIVMSVISVVSINLFAGESVGLIENLKGNTKKYLFKNGVSARDSEKWNRAMESAGAFIQEYEPKLHSKFMDLQVATNVLFNVIQIIQNKYIVPFKKKVEESLFETVDKKMVSNIEQQIQPLHGELKKIKGISTGSLFKKSEAQKVLNAIKDILVKRLQEVLDEFKEFKKNPVL